MSLLPVVNKLKPLKMAKGREQFKSHFHDTQYINIYDNKIIINSKSHKYAKRLYVHAVA